MFSMTLKFYYTGVPDQMVDAVTLLRDRAESDEANILYSLVNDLSKVGIDSC